MSGLCGPFIRGLSRLNVTVDAIHSAIGDDENAVDYRKECFEHATAYAAEI
jgi:hypothetical protein